MHPLRTLLARKDIAFWVALVGFCLCPFTDLFWGESGSGDLINASPTAIPILILVGWGLYTNAMDIVSRGRKAPLLSILGALLGCASLAILFAGAY